MKPDITKLTGTRHAVYDKLNDKGYVPEETHIENGDVIIGKVTPIQPAPGSNKCFKDSSEIYKSIENAIIDRVFTGIYDSEGYEMIKIRTRSERVPKIGDKFCLKLDHSNPFEVLTNRGWLKLEDINLNDKIATLVDDEEIVYDYPIGIYKFKYTGSMYKVKSNEVYLDVTMDHKMYIKYCQDTNFKLEDAKNIIGKDVIYKTFNDNTVQDVILTNKYEEIFDYDGMVGCLEVPSHVFLIRYYDDEKYKCVWTGNCSRHGLNLIHNRRLWVRENPIRVLN